VSNEVKAGGASVRVGLNPESFFKGISDVEKRLKSFGAGLSAVGGGLVAGGISLVAPLTAMVVSFAEAGGAIDDMSQRTGASVESLSELTHAFTMSGLGAAELEASMKKLNKFMADAAAGEKGATADLDGLGLKYRELKDLSPDQQFELITNKLGALKGVAAQTDAAMAIFGKSGADLIPLLGNVSALREEAVKLGLVMSSEDAAAAAEFGDAMDKLGAGAQALTNNIGAALAPTLTTILDEISKLIKPTVEWVSENKGLIVSVAAIGAGLLVAGTVITGLGITIASLGAIIGGIGTGIAAFGGMIAGIGATIASVTGGIVAGVTMLLSPIGLAVAAVVALGAVILTQTDIGKDAISSLSDGVSAGASVMGDALGWLSDQFSPLLSVAKQTFQGIFDAIASGNLQLAGEIAMKGLEVAWRTGIEILRDQWSTLTINLEGVLDQFQTQASQVWLTIAENMQAAFDAAYSYADKAFNRIASEAAQAAIEAQYQIGLISEKDRDNKKTVIQAQEMGMNIKALNDQLTATNERAAVTEGARNELNQGADQRERGRQERIDGLNGDDPALTAARADLARLTTQAAQAKADAVSKAGAAGSDIPETLPDLASKTDTQKPAAAMAGSKEAAAAIARSITGGGKDAVPKQQLDVLQQMKTLQERMAAQAEKNLTRLEKLDKAIRESQISITEMRA